MRKDQVFAAGVNVEGLTQLLHAHGGAFDVPTRTSFTPGCGPNGVDLPVGIACGFPERKVARVLLTVLIRVDRARAGCQTGTGASVLELDAGQLAVGGQRANGEVDRAIVDVGVTALDQPLDE